jgi:hypothetical protein
VRGVKATVAGKRVKDDPCKRDHLPEIIETQLFQKNEESAMIEDSLGVFAINGDVATIYQV